MNKLKQITLWLICLVLVSCGNLNKPGDEEAAETDEILSEQDNKMAWWREARFGMFIHWGLYAVPAGEWNGEKIPGISEWIMLRAKIPVNEYESLSKASQRKIEKYKITDNGSTILWDEMKVSISVNDILNGKK